MLGERLHGVDDRRHRRQGEEDARHVDRSGLRVARLRHQDRHEHDQRQQHGHREQEHRTPGEVLEQHTADERADRGSDGEARRPDRDGESALIAIGEETAQEREGRGHQHRAEEAQRGAGADQGRSGRREGGSDRDDGESDRTDQQEAAPPDAVAETSHRHQQAGQHERVRVDDPEQLGARRTQALGDRGQREVQHCVVDRDQQHRQHQHREGHPRTASDPVGGAGRIDGGNGSGTRGHRGRPFTERNGASIPSSRYTRQDSAVGWSP
ncbi:hypothetical protein ACH61_00692 [Rathayibacter tanaceti]|uniref:Uncharacterized protein n=1 Tax=Rathayibacter tanaceti TaxID=1671680 RepID=A0A166IDM2_9MICO|nr:hypothetical protein ACH61_00692 [Rathayibacter tanaceti]